MVSTNFQGFDTHISERYNKNLLGIFNSLLAMGGVVEEQLNNVHTSITKGNITERVETINEIEQTIDRMDIALNDSAIQIIATNQPIASDLRLLIAAVKISAELEHIGDEIQRTHTLLVSNEDAMEVENSFSFEELSYLIDDQISMLRRALNAFARLDTEEAHKVMKSDRKIDKECNNLNRVLLTYIMQDPSRVGIYVDIANMLRSLERVGDYIANIAEHLVFIITGTDVRYMSTKEIGKMLKQD